MREIQIAMQTTSPTPNSRVLSVIQAVLTRWTAHYLAYERLLDLKWVVETLVRNDELLPREEKRVINGDADARQKATKMVVIIKDALFWHSLARYIFY